MRARTVLAAMMFGAVAAAAGAQDVDQARRELDRLDAEARAAADRAWMASEEAQRLAAEARARAEGDARQRALAAEYERRRSESAARAQAAQAEADLGRRAAEQRLRAAEGEASRAVRRPSEAPALTPPLQPSTTAPRRRGPAAPPTAAPAPVIEMKEAVTLCQRERRDRWRCTGPLRVAYGDIRGSRAAAVDACGAAPIRDLGTVRGLRAFGCGFGLNPRSSAPGNRDVPALFGVEIPGRLSFRCASNLPAGCRSR